MSSQILSVNRSFVLVGLIVVCGAILALPTDAARADECLAAPKSQTPKGSHWYYYTDHAKHRKCWFLAAERKSSQQSAAKANSNAAPVAPAGADGSKKHATAVAGGCLTAPNYPAPEGSHWYYRTDRVNNRKCWHLRAAVDQPQAAATNAKLDATPAADEDEPKNAHLSAGAPPSKSDAASSAASRSHEAKSARTKHATEDGDATAGREVRNDTATPPVAETPAAKKSTAQADPPWPTYDQTVGMGADADGIWDDRVAEPPENAAAPNSAANGNRADPGLPTADANRSDRADIAAQTLSSKPVAKRVAAGPVSPEILLIAAIVLGVVGLLYRFAVRFASIRLPRIVFDRSGSDWIDDWHEQEWSDDVRPEQQGHIDELHPSPPLGAIPMDADRGRLHEPPYERGDRSPALHLEPAVENRDAVSERENKLKEMIRELDELLQSRTRA